MDGYGEAQARRKAPSLADVARRAGVSLTTASHALTGKRTVNRDTIEAVRQAIAELGYVPHHAGQTLASGRTLTLGVVVPDISNPFFAELAKGVEDFADTEDYKVLVANTHFDPQREDRALRLVSARAVDGLIYAAGTLTLEPTVRDLMGQLPLVILDEELPIPGASTVASDHEAGGKLVADHLLQLGHRHILVLEGPKDLRSSMQRSQALRAVELGSASRIEFRTGDYQGSWAKAAVEAELTNEGAWFTAVYAHNDLSAANALLALTDAGIRVPEMVSVVGFDDIALARYLRPALTTVQQSVQELGRKAAEEVLKAMNDGSRGERRHVLPVSLITRDSTAPPPSREQWIRGRP